MKFKQKEFFEFIKYHHQSNTNFTNEIADILNLSHTSIYKKLRGEVSLSLEEVVKLKDHFNFSFDQFFYSKLAPTSFQFDALRSSPSVPYDFLRNVSYHLDQLTKAKSIYYLYICNEIPLYHMLQFPLLARFKLYVWNVLSWRIKGTTEDSFTKETYSDTKGWDSIVKRMLKMYFDNPGKEIWNTLFFDVTIEQIKYMYLTGDLKSIDLALDILNELEKLRNLLMDFTKKGMKYMINNPDYSSANGEFYYTSLYTGSELVHVESDGRSTIITGFDTPNLMVSMDPRMTAYSKKHFENIMRYSINITKTNMIQRNKFFNGLLKKIVMAEKEIKQFHDMKN